MEKPTILKEKKPSVPQPKPSWLRRFNDWFHLWIGIAVGIPVIIISLTGCILVFEHEIVEMSRSWWQVEIPAQTAQLPPSAIQSKVLEQLPEMKIRRLWYYGEGKPVKISPDNSDSLIFANPYNGKVLALEDHEDIFEFIDEGHRNLWFPPEIGKQVVGWSTAIFLVLTITGIVLWLPKNWKLRELKQAFSIKWKAKFKRLNYDLHNVLGFYSLSIAVLMALTGLMMSFRFVNSSVLKMLGAKDRSSEVSVIGPGPKVVPATIEGKVDLTWKLVTTQMGEFNKEEISIHFPKEDGKSIYACTDMHNGTWRELNFDINTLALLSTSHTKIADDTAANWVRRSNFSLHVGAFGGLFTKWLFFFASLICGTLPITGFVIWWGKRKKKNKFKK
ncbi:PepSY-associated TM helix domain-containing protein [Dyadobacter psychrotolerans]|uniref:PepSY domain-containing protein n=1 Tax=Dyadobacter psychrotolerans TaxID=2541721 RepID=A0A4R5D9H9_9BACT|nr:PepSY-associated TM helix domain-containing protein [Dyadobacter psychrotolerans]TDE08074.1 PepSY domain-containing protein [Dyadobacter psychrotolerans]